MVGVVVNDDGAVALALDLKPAAGALEFGRGALGVGGGKPQRPHTAAHCKRVINVVVARHAKLQVGEMVFKLVDIKLIKTGAIFPDVDRAESGFLLNAEGEHRPVDRIDDVEGVAVIHIEDNGAGKQRKLLERKLKPPHRAIVIKVVVVDVQDHADKRGQLQEGLTEFAGLDNGRAAMARLAVAADERQLAADDGGRVMAGQLKHRRNHAGRCGFAVGAGHPDTLRVEPADIAQQHAALHRLDAAGVGGVKLRVAGVDRRAVDDKLRIAEVGRVMPDRNSHPHRALGRRNLGLLHIGAREGQPAAVQNLDQRIHARPAAADQVNMGHPFEQFGVIGRKIGHRYLTSYSGRAAAGLIRCWKML